MSEVQIELAKWKGIDEIQIFEHDVDTYVIIEHRKDKETWEVKTSKKYIPKKDVKYIFDLIVELTKDQYKLNYREIISELISRKGWDDVCDRDNFNGGRNRAKYYFPYYYYPLKILEYYKKITYLGKGGVEYFGEKYD